MREFSTFYIKTYGCQMNERDSESLTCLLESQGYRSCPSEEDADILIFNTCSVRDQAERKVVGKIGLMKKLKRLKPELVIGIIGCVAQRLGENLFRQLPHLNFVVGTDQLHTVPEVLEKIRRGENHLCNVTNCATNPTELDGHRPDSIFAQVAIMRGCNQFCTYCIVPFTRGRERSRPIPDIVKEVRWLADHGTREILLLGQNITAFGVAEARTENRFAIAEFSEFADLLAELNEIPGLERIRFTSPHVKYMNDKFVRAICTLPKVCKCFHIPLQSGSDRILQMMHRGYTAGEYLDRIHAIQALAPQACFSTDVIVGFPTETEDDFNCTRNLMEEVGFDMAYIFRYSQRDGTVCAKSLPDDIAEEIKHERNQLLLADLERRVNARNQSLVGQPIEVLVEGISKRNAERWTGRSDTNKTVNFTSPSPCTPGQLVRVAVKRATANSLSGEIILPTP